MTATTASTAVNVKWFPLKLHGEALCDPPNKITVPSISNFVMAKSWKKQTKQNCNKKKRKARRRSN
jgi:hypothetical protein